MYMYDPKGAGQSFTYDLMLGYRVLGNVYTYMIQIQVDWTAGQYYDVITILK